MKRILIQGAVPSEICFYLEQACFSDVPVVSKNECSFYLSHCGGLEIILQLTRMGMVNAAMATTAAIYEFRPDCIVNQGTAGAQVMELTSGDIVIGRRAVNVHSLEMKKRGFGEGMAVEDWAGMATEYVEADPELVRVFQNGIGSETKTGKVITGTLGSGDLFSKEKDRILWLHDKFGNDSEDMESFAVYSVCRDCGVPCVAVRVISNNELLDEDYDPRTSLELQRVIWKTVLDYGEKK